MSKFVLYNGNCVDVLKTMEDNSVDSVVTDPPYELGFMGKSWDSSGIAYSVEMWSEVMRVLKPGGHLLAFSGTRTYHRMVVAIEDAGFDIRDQIGWVFGSGFPHGTNISKSISAQIGIGLCTCSVSKQINSSGDEHGKENINTRDNKSTGYDDRLGTVEKNRSHRKYSTKVESGKKNTHIPNDTGTKTDPVCNLRKTNITQDQGVPEIKEPILFTGMCRPTSENQRLGNVEIWEGMEENKTAGERKGQSLSGLQTDIGQRIGSPSSGSVSVWGEKYDGKPNSTVSELPQHCGKQNAESVRADSDNGGNKQWGIRSEFICPECNNLREDIGGTSLKPAWEPICVARKPLSEKTVAKNVLKHGTGGINIDGCRVPTNDKLGGGNNSATVDRTGKHEGWQRPWMQDTESVALSAERSRQSTAKSEELGRFPANIIHDGSDEVLALFPESKGQQGDVKGTEPSHTGDDNTNCYGEYQRVPSAKRGDTGSAARFFYCAKASRSDRNEGLQDPGPQFKHGATLRKVENTETKGNNHPTVKPTDLMKYLCRLVTPKGGTVLDPFNGSGSTGKAAMLEGFNYIGIDLDPDYIKISQARIQNAKEQYEKEQNPYGDLFEIKTPEE